MSTQLRAALTRHLQQLQAQDRQALLEQRLARIAAFGVYLENAS